MDYKKMRDDYFEECGIIFKILSSPIKLKLINFISFAPRTVEECALKVSQSIQNTSLHLIAMYKIGILEVNQVKNFRYYSLSSHAATEFVTQALLLNPKTLLPSDLLWNNSSEKLINEFKSKNLKLIDLRSFEETQYIPLPDADLFVGPLSSILDFLKSYSKKDQLIFICKGKMCERLARAVHEAKRARYNVKALAIPANELYQLSFALQA
jgi:DNA-binding transcriptional ArsR family regulator